MMIKIEDPTLKKIVDTLKRKKISVYGAYEGNNEVKRPEIHIDMGKTSKEDLLDLVNLVGRYNLSIPSDPMVLRPHNYGDWESYLSLEPSKECKPSELELFMKLLEGMPTQVFGNK